MACPAITGDKNYFLIKDVISHDPEDASKFCLGRQQEWKTFFSTEAMRTAVRLSCGFVSGKNFLSVS